MDGGKPPMLCKSAKCSFFKIKYPTWSPETNRRKRRRLIYKYVLLKGIITNVCTSCEQIMFVVHKRQHRGLDGSRIQRGSTYWLKVVQQLTVSVRQTALLSIYHTILRKRPQAPVHKWAMFQTMLMRSDCSLFAVCEIRLSVGMFYSGCKIQKPTEMLFTSVAVRDVNHAPSR
jgi:hypothetical protein